MSRLYRDAATLTVLLAAAAAGTSGINALSGCSTVPPRTVNDVAQEACEVVFAIDSERIPHGKSVKEFCELHENLRPFIDRILAAKQIAGANNGMPGADGGALDSAVERAPNP